MIDYVDNNKHLSPEKTWYGRGDWYDWCRVLANNTLEFGFEQGNYAGGPDLNYNFYGLNSYPEDHEVTKEYWDKVNERLDIIKAEEPEYYEKIIAMAREHDIKEVLTGR